MTTKLNGNAYYDYDNKIYHWSMTGTSPRVPAEGDQPDITLPDGEQIMDICTEPEKQFAYRYLRTSHAEAMGWSAIKCVWASSANIAMTTLQDLLSLGADARMNTPATIGGKNWRWRVRAEALNPTVAALLGDITKTYMRG